MDGLRRTTSLLLLLSALLISGAESYQSWLEQPRYTEVNPSGQVVLKCLIASKKGQCRWEKDGQPQGIFPGKYEWAGAPESGDCSLKIFNASLEYEDGVWQCQVTPSSFNSKDALISEGAQLVVRESPSGIAIQRVGDVGLGTDPAEVVASAGEELELECVVSGGNPPATVRWFAASEEIVSGHSQENSRSSADPRKWISISRLVLPVSKTDDGAEVRCVAEHPTAAGRPLSARARLVIHYPPSIRIETSPLDYLEEGKDPASLRCVADSNPPSSIIWRKEGLSGIFSPDAEIAISPVSRQNAGVYTCTAENALGNSQTKFVELDIKYPPEIVNIGPASVVTAKVGKEIILTCEAEANPPPRYQWLQRTRNHQILIRGYERNLVLQDVDYDHQGEYVCKAVNEISGEERSVQSQEIHVDVTGAPRVSRKSTQSQPHSVRVQNGEDASLEVEFCADPAPRLAWHLQPAGEPAQRQGQELTSTTSGPLTLSAGIASGRFFADSARKLEGRDDCYVAAFRINGAHADDTRAYLLRLENDDGEETHTVHLTVKDHVSRESLIAVAVGAVLTLLLLVLICVYCCKAEKCCSGCGPTKKEFKPTDLESEKTDIESTHSSNASNFDGNKLAAAANAIPPDALYGEKASASSFKRVSPGLPSYDSAVIPAAETTMMTNTDSKESLRPPSASPPTVTFSGSLQVLPQHDHQVPLPPRPASRQVSAGPPRIVYNDLCFPKTSNYGSMKKKGQRERTQQQQALLNRLNQHQQEQQVHLPQHQREQEQRRFSYAAHNGTYA